MAFTPLQECILKRGEADLPARGGVGVEIQLTIDGWGVHDGTVDILGDLTK